MFKFDGRLTRRPFLIAALIRLGLFAASIFGFPFLLLAILKWSNCEAIGGACGAVGLVFSTAFKPLVFFLFIFSFLGISLRRARDAGLPALIGLCIPGLFAADHTYLIYAGAPWSFAFSSGVLFETFPGFALLALVCVAIFSAIPSNVDFAARGARTDRESQTSEVQTVSDTTAARPSPPIARLVGVAFALALSACAITFSRQFPGSWPFVLLTSLGTAVLPTTAVYCLPIFGLWMIAVRRTAGSLVMLLLALVPFGQWGYAHWSAFQASRQERAEIASIPTQALPHIPATIVVESFSVIGMRAAFKVPEIERIISKGAYGRELAQFERPQPRSRASTQSKVTALPEEYLLLRVGHSSGFAKARQSYAAAGGPLELRYVDPSHDELIAVWYRAFDPAPSALPVITTSGWFRDANSATTEEIEARVAEFLTTALNKAG